MGDRLGFGQALREQHSHGESWHPGALPDAVCFPRSTEEVCEIVKVCASHSVPLIPFGAGTSLEGNVHADRGGVCVDLSQMNTIVDVHTEDFDCQVQAGVTRRQLNEYLRDTGLFFPVDPGADATIGGMASTRASGTNAVRYGTMRENVLGLTVVTANGKAMKVGTRARKSSAGYDLKSLFVGAEGTLGIITEVTLRLYPMPEAMSAAVVNFPDVESATKAAITTIQFGIPIARVELMDKQYMGAVNGYSKTDYLERDTLFLEFHGTEAWVAEQAEQFGEIAAEFGGGDFQWAVKEEDRRKLWRARHNAYYAGLAMSPNGKGYVTDVCVPISRLSESIEAVRKDLAETNLVSPILGHVGDGNFHLTIFIDTDDAESLKDAEQLNLRLVKRAIEMGGTCTGEHGVGSGKLKSMKLEHDQESLELMRVLKQTLDPQNIFNPGKVVSI